MIVGAIALLTKLGVRIKELFLFRAPLAAEFAHHLNFLGIDADNTVAAEKLKLAGHSAQVRELMRFQGTCLVATNHASFPSYVSLKERGPHGCCLYRRHDAGEVVGETDRYLWKEAWLVATKQVPWNRMS